MPLKAFRRVYRRPAYVLLTLAVSFATFATVVWLPNFRLVATILPDADISFASKVELLVSLLGAIGTNHTYVSAVGVIVMSVLFGVYVSMMAYFLNRRIEGVTRSGMTTGVVGLVSGVVGVGCAACGSFLLTSLSLVGASGLLAFLPFDGAEFGVIGIALLVAAIYVTARKIENPAVCRIQ